MTEKRICEYPNCTQPHQAKGLCTGHYFQKRRNQPLRPLGTPKNHLKNYFHQTVTQQTNQCIQWPYTQSHGYGYIKIDGTPKGVHVLAYEHTNGPVPNGKQINHKCHNPLCYNPKHVYAGTQQQNIQDQLDRGTHTTQKQTAANPATIPKVP